MIALILFGTFFLLLAINVPIALALAISSFLGIWKLGLPLSMVATNLYAAPSKFVLLAIPFFVLSGNIMEKSDISRRLINFAEAMVGHTRNGMAMVCVIVACFFAAISGSGPATVAALGVILIPAMTKVGYKTGTSTALVSISGAIGIIIPPSIGFVVYGSVTGLSVGKLFASGILPGILMGMFLYLSIKISTRHEKLIQKPKATAAVRWATFKDAFWGILMPVIILGGIYGGIFTPTEAAAVAAVYGFIVGFFIYRTLTLKSAWEIIKKTVNQTGAMMIVIAGAALFAWVLQVSGVAAKASNGLVNIVNGNKYLFLLIINIILLITGMFIDANSAFYILVPILYPVAQSLGIDGIHLGCIMVMNMAIGLVTPPVGVNLYVGTGIAGCNVKEVIRAVWPLVGFAILALLLVTYIPAISMTIPNLMLK